MAGFLKSSIKAVSGLLFGESESSEEYEFSNDPQLDAENAKLYSQFKMLNAQLGSQAVVMGGMSMAQYNEELRREGSGR